jgi:hypothetical protein
MIYNIVENIKIRKLGWVGHVIRMEGEELPKMFLVGNFIIQGEWRNQEQDGKT